MQTKSIKKGTNVVVRGNAKGTTWEKGVIVNINAEGALIDYNYPHGIYGQGLRVVLSELDVDVSE